MENLAENENRISYKDLSYKILFSKEDTFKADEVDFLKKFDLLENLATSKTNINNANIDQIHLIINLMQEYDKMICFTKK